jgi:hypothetical protein
MNTQRTSNQPVRSAGGTSPKAIETYSCLRCGAELKHPSEHDFKFCDFQQNALARDREQYESRGCECGA